MDEKKKEALKAFRQRLYGYQKAKSKDPDLTWWGYRSQKYDEDTDFQYQNWKNSLPDNLQEPQTVSPPYREFKEGEYNLYGAYQGGAQPRMQGLSARNNNVPKHAIRQRRCKQAVLKRSFWA